jgi:thioredoxin 1
MVEITQDNFEREVMKSDKPVLVDFWAPWCVPCKIIAPIVAELADDMKASIKVGKTNVDDNPELANALSVLNIPTLVLFKNGEEASRIVGVNSKESIAAKIQEHI